VDRAALLARAANATAWTGRGADAIDLIDAAIERVDPATEPVRAAQLHQRRGLYLWWLERGAEAVQDFERAVELIPGDPPSAERAHALARLGFILMLAGRHAESREYCEAAVAVARTVGARVDEADALASLGLDRVVLGDRAAGLEALRQARSIAAETGDDEMLSQTAIALSTGLMRDGRLEEARDADHPALAATVEAEHARAEGTPDPERMGRRGAGLGGTAGTVRGARARWREAEAALACRDRVRAAPVLRAAHATATGLGAAGLRSELESLARRARIELADREPSRAGDAASGAPAAPGDFGLTPRETEVLGRLALGETNRQIADELYISIKTAGLHVSHILGKLGAANRGEAAAIAHRLHLVP
jgi:DNA-binding CsgD family transcriptional regulator/tetratricopeptide (TPR) repeat protein